MLRFADKSVVVAVSLLAVTLTTAVASPARADSVTLPFVQLDPGPDPSGNFLMTASEGYTPLGLGDDWVHFNFKHQGSEGAIRSIYFDEGGLDLFDTSVSPYFDGTGNVAFSTNGAPANLPGWEDIDPDFHATWSFHADKYGTGPVSTTVKPGEELDIVLKLMDGKTFQNVKSALPNKLHIGLFVQDAFQDEDMGFVSAKFLVAPLPAAAWPGIALLGALGLAAAYRRRRRLAA